MEKKKKYEYKVLYEDLCANNFDSETFLNKMGDMGWELVSAIARTNGKPILYLRRKKAEKKIALLNKNVKKSVKPVVVEETMSREMLRHRMLIIIVDKLGCDETEVTEDASFTDDLGADSLDAVELLMEFEKEFGVGITDERAEKVQTFGDAVDLLYELINK